MLSFFLLNLTWKFVKTFMVYKYALNLLYINLMKLKIWNFHGKTFKLLKEKR